MKDLLLVIRQQPVRIIGFAIIAIVVVCAVGAPLLAPADPLHSDPALILTPPSLGSLLGRDDAGMDVLSRIMWGGRVDLTIALTATLISCGIGIPFGVASGYLRGWLPEVISRVFDLMQSLPVFVLAMAIVAVRGPSVINVIVVLAVLNSPIFVRLMRSQTYALRDRAFIEASRVAGFSDVGIIVRHLIPNAIGPALAQMSVTAGLSILLTAGLSFVGAGVRPPQPEWGGMVAAGASDIVTGEWWPALFPSLVIGLSVVAFALIGETLEIVVDPRKARRVGAG